MVRVIRIADGERMTVPFDTAMNALRQRKFRLDRSTYQTTDMVAAEPAVTVQPEKTIRRRKRAKR